MQERVCKLKDRKETDFPLLIDIDWDIKEVGRWIKCHKPRLFKAILEHDE